MSPMNRTVHLTTPHPLLPPQLLDTEEFIDGQRAGELGEVLIRYTLGAARDPPRPFPWTVGGELTRPASRLHPPSNQQV